MPAPSPALLETDPPSLNPFQRWPFFVDEFPAKAMFGSVPFADATPRGEIAELPRNPNRKEL